MAAYRLGIDVGGTFTDVVILSEGEGQVRHTKVITNRSDPASSVLEGVSRALREFAVDPEEVAAILHGTTIATNALIERRGARTALLTSRGMRDVLEIGRQIRPSLFDWFADKPEPLVPRSLRFELNERVNAKGELLDSPSEDEIRAIVDRLRAEGIESVAICFLFSFLRPEHEETVAAVVRREMPGLPISLSSQVLPEYREYERASTTVANAYLTPILSRYAGRLGASLGEMGLSAKLHLLQSNGGVAPLESARERAITTALSGPAGGVTGASHLSSSLGIRDVISMDMGGTSCDVCLIRDGLPSWTSEAPVAGLPVRVPMIAVEAIGAGGGSVIWVDSGGALRVGPHSAGSDPGPAAYGRGGQVPTLTDAHAVLGTVLPDYFPQKGIHLDTAASEEALKTVAGPLGMSVEDTAVGAIRIINHHIAQAVRGISVARGHDPRDFVLLGFGGAGPMHVCFVAEELGIGRIVLPFAAGVFSALGAALADFRYDYVRTLPARMKALEMPEVVAAHESMEASARERLAGLPVTAVRIDRSVDLRYVGQSFEITVPVDAGRYDKEEMLARFHRLHDESYGYSDANEPVELVNVRLTAFGETSKPPALAEAASGAVSEPALGRRTVPSFNGGDSAEFTLYDRTRFRPGTRISGPAIVTDPNSTAIILPGWRGEVDAQGSIQLERWG
jgi:N-methylhydantoinase A